MIKEIKDIYIVLGHKLISLLNSGDGTVSKNWIGIWDDDKVVQHEINQVFNNDGTTQRLIYSTDKKENN